LALTYDALGLTASADEAFRKAIALDKYYADYNTLMKALIWTPQQAKKLQIIANRVLEKQK